MKNTSVVLAALALLTATNVAHSVILSDFDGAGINYSEGFFDGGGAVGITPGGPTGSSYSLLSSVNLSNRNYISFDSAADYTDWTNINFTMDLFADNVGADGFGINFISTDTHGTSGLVRAGSTGVGDAEERGLMSDSFGVGFRTFNGTNATVSYNGVESADVAYPLAPAVWASLEINIDRNFVSKDVLLDVTLYDQQGQAGNSQNVFTDYAVSNVTLENFRMQLAGRTGGAAMDLSIDNLNLDVTVFDPTDTDGDELPDDWEVFYGLDENDNGLNPNNNGVVGDPNNGALGDPDMDTLTNEMEFAMGTNPVEDDTDMDGLNDNVEDLTGVYAGPASTGTNPLVPDSDGDGLLDGVEKPNLPFLNAAQPGTDPNKPDSDGDEVYDLDEILLGRNPTGSDPLTPAPPLLADFDGNGDTYIEGAVRAAPKGFLVPGGPTGNYYQLLNNVGDAGNYIAFDSTDDFTGWTNAVFQMDFLAENVFADGFGINFLSTSAHGESGLVQAGGGGVEERALIANSFGVGFRTFEGTNAAMTWNETDQSGDVAYTLTPDVWGSMQIEIDRDPSTKDAMVDVTLFDEIGQGGTAQNVFTDFAISNFDMEDFRAQIAGRTGGSAMDLCIDNVKLIVGSGADEKFRILSIARQFVPGNGVVDDSYSVTITWESDETLRYKILASPDMPSDFGNWDEQEDDWGAAVGQSTTSYTETGIAVDTKRRYYVVIVAEPF